MAAARLLLLGVASAATQEESRPSEAECRTLGFAPSLLCSSCAKLGDVLGDDVLVRECQQCCTAEDAEAMHYAKAILDVCR